MNLLRRCYFLIFGVLLSFGFANPPVFAQSATSKAEPSTSNSPSAVTDPEMAKDHLVENSVVKVFATVMFPDPDKPWTKQSPSARTGSGVVIEGKRILTNAHLVKYASQVQIMANQSGDQISATVESMDPGIDLAVLKLDDEKFFDTHFPLPRATSLPEIKDAVMVYGYPTGGEGQSITKGIVSRIDFSNYSYFVSGLRIQIDAAINPGNSGGPAVVGNKMIGLAFSSLNNTQNIGYIIPCEEIELFLNAVALGPYQRKPAAFFTWQTLQNSGLRSFLKLPSSTTKGIVVTDPRNSMSDYPLKKLDMITKIGDTPVDDEGMVNISDKIRVKFEYLIQKIARGGKFPLSIIRDGKEMQISLPTQTDNPLVIPYLRDKFPSYFIFGPIVFSNATMDFIEGYTKNANSSNRLLGSQLLKRMYDQPAFPNEQLVVVSSPFFPHKLSDGYSSNISKVLQSVNGVPIKNLNHLIEVLRDSKDEFLIFEFEKPYSETLVFKRSDILATTEGILNDNGIRSQGSPDTLAIWTAKPAH